MPWASTSDVAGGEDILLLIERWQAELAQAQARGQRWDPLPPGVCRPPRPAPARPALRARVGSLRARFRTH